MIQNHVAWGELKNQGGILLFQCFYIVQLHLQTAAYEGFITILHILKELNIF